MKAMRRVILLSIVVLLVTGLLSGCRSFGRSAQMETFKLTVLVEVDHSSFQALGDERLEAALADLGYADLDELSEALIRIVTIGDLDETYQRDTIARFSVVFDLEAYDRINSILCDNQYGYLAHPFYYYELTDEDVDGWYDVYDEEKEEYTVYAIVTMNTNKTITLFWRLGPLGWT